MVKEEIGNRIRKIRKEKEYSQDYIAMKLGISQATYQRIESGQAEKVDIDTIVKIAEVLEVDPVELIFKNEKQVFLNCEQSGNIQQIHNNVSEDLLSVLRTQMEALNQQMAMIIGFLKK